MMERALKELEAFLTDCGLTDESVFDGKLVASELISNVFQHSSGSARLESEIAGEDVKIKVSSSKAFVPPEKSTCSGVYEESGRGLYIIDCISEKRFCTSDGGICVSIKATFVKR